MLVWVTGKVEWARLSRRLLPRINQVLRGLLVNFETLDCTLGQYLADSMHFIALALFVSRNKQEQQYVQIQSYKAGYLRQPAFAGTPGFRRKAEIQAARPNSYMLGRPSLRGCRLLHAGQKPRGICCDG